MNNKPVLILVALLGMAAVVFGVLQMARGIGELGDGLPSAADAREAADSAAGKLSRYTVADKSVSLLYPQDWTVTTPAQPPVLCSFKTFKGVVNYSLMSQDVAAGTQLAAYIATNVDGIQGALAKPEQALQMLGQTDRTLGGLPAVQLVYSYRPEPNLEVEVTQIYAIREQRAYAVTWTMPKSMHGMFDTLLGKILESVQFS